MEPKGEWDDLRKDFDFIESGSGLNSAAAADELSRLANLTGVATVPAGEAAMVTPENLGDKPNSFDKVKGDIAILIGEGNMNEKHSAWQRLRGAGIDLPEHVSEKSSIPGKLYDALDILKNEAGERPEDVSWAKHYLESRGVDFGDAAVVVAPGAPGAPEPPRAPEPVPAAPETELPKMTLEELISSDEKLFREIFLRDRDESTSHAQDSLDAEYSLKILEASGMTPEEVREIQERIQREYYRVDPATGSMIFDSTYLNATFEMAQKIYLDGILNGGFSKVLEQAEAIKRLRKRNVKVAGMEANLVKELDGFYVGLTRKGWPVDEGERLLNLLDKKLNLNEPEEADKEIDVVRNEFMSFLEAKLQFESGAKFLAPSVSEFDQKIESYKVSEESKRELRSLAGLMLASRATLYMKQDARVWSGISPDTYQDQGWVSLAKRGLEDSVVLGFLSGKETDNFKRENVSKALQKFYSLKEANNKGLSVLETRQACERVSTELGISQYEARVAWMMYEQLFEPEYNEKNHLFGLTHPRKGADNLKSIWWGSKWMLKRAVVMGDLSGDPFNTVPDVAAGEPANGMPQRMWTAPGERLYMERQTTRDRIDFRTLVANGSAMDFFQEFFDKDNLPINQGYLTKLQTSAVVMQGYHKKITDAGLKPETSSTKYLLDLRATLLRDARGESDPRAKLVTDGRYTDAAGGSNKFNFMNVGDIERTLTTVARVVLLETSVLQPGVDEKVLLDPGSVARFYLDLAASYDGVNNYFSFDGGPSYEASLPYLTSLREFAFRISRKYASDQNLMSSLKEKNGPRYDATLRLVQSANNFILPTKPSNFRDLYTNFQGRVAYKPSLKRTLGSPVEAVNRSSGKALDDLLRSVGLGWLAGDD